MIQRNSSPATLYGATCNATTRETHYSDRRSSILLSTVTLDNNVDRTTQAKAEFAAGQTAFERGNYREAVSYFERGTALASGTTPLGGELQLWLVNAYAAANRPEDAIALCEKLTRHPDLDTRKEGKRLLYILKAPRLRLKAEWRTEIPDLSHLEADGTTPLLSRYATAALPPKRTPNPEPEPEDLTQINTRDNGFLWAALLGIGLMVASLVWLR